MAHEIENMFYVGKTPWHSLGTPVQPDIKIPEALKAAGLDWFVSKEPLYLSDGTEVPDSWATVRCKSFHDSNQKNGPVPDLSEGKEREKNILGVVGARYQVYQNWEAFQWFEPYLDAKVVQLHTAGSLQGGKRVWILAKVNGMFTVAANDNVELYLLLSHAHDGTMDVRAGTTPIRVVCANTLKLAHNDPASKLFRAKHSRKSLRSDLEEFRQNIDQLIHGFEVGGLEAYKHLASIRLNEESLKTYIFDVFDLDPESKDHSTRILNQVERVTQLFDQGLGNNLASVAGTAWTAYNAFTQWTAYERGNNADTRLNSNWFGDSAKLNKRALDCALALSN